jgi:hypothetical protein
MQSKSVVLNAALIAAVLATLQSAPALASNPTNPAEAPIVVVGPDEEVNEKGEVNSSELAKNDVEDGAKDDGGHDAADGGKEDTAASVQDQQQLAQNESAQKDN